jgi:hypothetical protein
MEGVMTSDRLRWLRTEALAAIRQRFASLPSSRCLLAAFVLGQVALSGCQTPDSSTRGDGARSNDAASTSATVVGKLEVYQDGARVEMGFFSKVEMAGFVAAPHGSDHGTWLVTKSDGSFRWKLAPGEYDLVALRLQKGSGYSVIPIDGRLAVTSGAVVDVGTLLAETDRFGARLRRTSQAASAASDGTNPLQLRSWSTAGHFTFLIVAMSRSSGRPFEFETP